MVIPLEPYWIFWLFITYSLLPTWSSQWICQMIEFSTRVWAETKKKKKNETNKLFMIKFTIFHKFQMFSAAGLLLKHTPYKAGHAPLLKADLHTLVHCLGDKIKRNDFEQNICSKYLQIYFVDILNKISKYQDELIHLINPPFCQWIRFFLWLPVYFTESQVPSKKGPLYKERIRSVWERKWVYPKRKEFAPRGSKFFPYSADPFSEGYKNNIDRVVLPERIHYDNRPIQIYWKFYNQKNENFQIKEFDIFHIPAPILDSGYSLEPLGEAALTSTRNLCFEQK